MGKTQSKSRNLTEERKFNIRNENGKDDIQEEDGTGDSPKNGPYDSINKKDEASLYYGTHETQVSEGGEADLKKYADMCKKNPGHTKFIPVNNFNISHLPEGHNDNDIVEYIKAVADLTVRVAVTKTSTERPMFWPKTNQPYPFYDKRGNDVTRLGTGLVMCVSKWTEEGRKGVEKYISDTCECHKCQHSDTPSKVWGNVCVYTATHVVFDDLEARHTKCRLFFDAQDSLLVTLDGWKMVGANIEEDGCTLAYVTCDVDLLDLLDVMWRYCGYLRKKITKKYNNFRNKYKFTFIVSHPHGCPKQISVGKWITRYELDMFGGTTKYTYTTCTCPGSSGAYVYSLGYDEVWLGYRHVHSGVNSKGINFSGIGCEYPSFP